MSRVLTWQTWMVDFGHPVGSEQGGLRPAVIVASAMHSRFPIDMTIVVPLTTRDRGLPHHVPVNSDQAGLRRPSFARTEDIIAVSTQRLGPRPLGTLSEVEADEVRRWVHRMVG
ncbi:MAG: type II toxin-antitoxin system PemK/MazF family toxin [Micromonosporaceae bacterium]|nr:type II toxin-antitoxin system PemK/MazF family toxin [Micromonosporaceae bacterium]